MHVALEKFNTFLHEVYVGPRRKMTFTPTPLTTIEVHVVIFHWSMKPIKIRALRAERSLARHRHAKARQLAEERRATTTPPCAYGTPTLCLGPPLFAPAEARHWRARGLSLTGGAMQ